MSSRKLISMAALLALGLAAGACVEQTDAPATNAPVALTDDAAIIQSAMSAAPAAIGQYATIVAVSADGAMREVRAGTNGFSCMADNPATPGPDPMCGDANAMQWVHAWVSHQTPPEGKVGFMYMLAGGTDASNTDPYAATPGDGANWIETGPHVMIVGSPATLSSYPRGAAPDTTQPYVMWADTPYEHLMIPVR